LISALQANGQRDEAVAELRKAVELDSKSIGGHLDLASSLQAKGRTDEAVAEFRAAIRISPDDGGLYSNYGRILAYAGRHDEVIEACRQAIRLNPNDGGAHYNLANSLAAKGRLREALAAFRGAQRVEPRLAESQQWQLRYNAACAAARAAAGQGKDDPPADDAAKAKLRAEALNWLEAEHAAWAKLLDSGPSQARPAILQILERWRTDPDLAGIRAPGPAARGGT
jgi:tetratricopeptide (TPR) repeat protein